MKNEFNENSNVQMGGALWSPGQVDLLPAASCRPFWAESSAIPLIVLGAKLPKGDQGDSAFLPRCIHRSAAQCNSVPLGYNRTVKRIRVHCCIAVLLETRGYKKISKVDAEIGIDQRTGFLLRFPSKSHLKFLLRSIFKVPFTVPFEVPFNFLLWFLELHVLVCLCIPFLCSFQRSC